MRAPFAGVVTARTADIGDLVGPGATTQQPLFAVADVHAIRVYVSVPQAYSAAMTPGLTATLTVPDYPGRTFPAHVIGNSGAVNSADRHVPGPAARRQSGQVLKPGGYAKCVSTSPVRPARCRSRRARSSSARRARRWRSSVPTATSGMQSITLGRDLGGTVEVTAGLDAQRQNHQQPARFHGAGRIGPDRRRQSWLSVVR